MLLRGSAFEQSVIMIWLAINNMKGVFIVGGSGVGKTTLTTALSDHYKSLLRGQGAITINLDCANLSGKFDIDICDLITLEDIMQQCELGPNGGIMYAADFLHTNIEWLYQQIQALAIKKDPSFALYKQIALKNQKQQDYSLTLFFDLPGQMQLYLQSESMLSIVNKLVKRFKLRTCLLQLFDSTYIYQINDFVSMCMVALTTGINFEMPQINILSKIDLLKNRQPAHGMLQEYFKVSSLRELAKDLRLNDAPVLEKIEEIIDQYSRVSFAPCSVKIPDLILYLIFYLEKIFGTLQSNLYANRGFAQAMKPYLRDFADERMINDLEAELFGEEEDDWEAEIAKLRAVTEDGKKVQ